MTSRHGSYRVKEFEELDADPNQRPRVWHINWFGPLVRGGQNPTEHQVRILLSPLKPGADWQRAKPDDVDRTITKSVLIGVGQLVLLQIGSLWQHGLSLGRNTLPRLNNVQLPVFDHSWVSVISGGQARNGSYVIPKTVWELGAVGLKSHFLLLDFPGLPEVVVPAMELLRFYYCTSSTTAKAIWTGELSKPEDPPFNASSCDERTDGDDICRTVSLDWPDGYTRLDGYSLGRILLSERARGALQSVLASVYDQAAQGAKEIYPKMAQLPVDTTQWKARGLRIKIDRSRERLLVLAIEQCGAQFPFNKLVLRAGVEASLVASEDRQDGQRVVYPGPARAAADGYLQSRLEPDSAIRRVEIRSAEHRFPATSLVEVVQPKHRSDYPGQGRKRITLDEPTAAMGTGQRSGNHNRVTSANLVIENTVDKKNDQVEPDNRFVESSRLLAELTSNPEDGLTVQIRTSVPHPWLIPLTKLVDKRQWSYLRFQPEPTRRQVVIADIKVGQYKATFVEFEQRPSDSCCAALLLPLTGDYINDQDLAEILTLVATAEGRWKHVPVLNHAKRILPLAHIWTDAAGLASVIKRKLNFS